MKEREGGWRGGEGEDRKEETKEGDVEERKKGK